MDRDKLMREGNESMAIGALLGIGSLAVTCPICTIASAGFLLNGIREKVL
jgi:hypothetical protein